MASTYKLLIKSATGPLLLKIVLAFIGLIFNYTATQFLSTHEFGLFTISQLLVLILVTLSKFGLDSVLIKVIAISDANSKSTYKTVLATSLVFSLLVIFLFYIANPLFFSTIIQQDGLNSLLPFILMLIIPNVVLALNAGFLRGLKHANLSLVFSGVVTLSIATILIVIVKPNSALKLIQLVLSANVSSCLISLIIISKLIDDKVTYKTFFEKAKIHPNAHMIKGVVCGYRIENIEDEFEVYKQCRRFEKLIDELAKGRKMEKILRIEKKSK